MCSNGDFTITSGGDGHQVTEPHMLKVGYLIFQKFENNDYISEIISETRLDLGFILAKGLGFRPGKQFFFQI